MAFSLWLIIVLCVCAWASAAASRAYDIPSATKKFEEWMTRHGRDYKDVDEKAKRLKVFLENLQFVEQFNAAANRSYKVGLNKFSDLTNEEFVAAYTGYKLPPPTRRNSSKLNSFEPQDLDDVPESVDWVKEGAVNPIKNQGQCGSCWSFSVVAAVEAITKINSGVLPNLSEQQLIDCARDGNDGCQGGWMDNGFQYIIDNKGINSESNYPYVEADQDTCNSEAASVAEATISAYKDVPANEDDMMKAVAVQPVSAALDSSGTEFQHYSGGIYSGPCGDNLDHAVAVVGYGTETDGTKYWLIRNSWDVSWGESGYMKLQRDSGDEYGLCGIARKASYPVA